MARPLRIELAGGVYHLTSRGDRREPIYADDADRLLWLDLFVAVCERFNWRCHAWCQMGNHYHLVVQTAEENLPRGMRQLNGVSAQAVNRRHGGIGHVFQGRYKATLVEADAYLVALARYVVLNPVRAGLCGDGREWPWSSQRALMGLIDPPPWLDTDWMFGAVPVGADGCRASIRGLRPRRRRLATDLGGAQRADLPRQRGVCRRDGAKVPDDGRLSEVPRLQRRRQGASLQAYVDGCSSRDGAIAEAAASGVFTFAQLAEFFGFITVRSAGSSPRAGRRASLRAQGVQASK